MWSQRLYNYVHSTFCTSASTISIYHLQLLIEITAKSHSTSNCKYVSIEHSASSMVDPPACSTNFCHKMLSFPIYRLVVFENNQGCAAICVTLINEDFPHGNSLSCVRVLKILNWFKWSDKVSHAFLSNSPWASTESIAETEELSSKCSNHALGSTLIRSVDTKGEPLNVGSWSTTPATWKPYQTALGCLLLR